ncbi:uncharacterized protein TM35_000191100 [Trypanosoma theileri]|uniref:C3H1-type domain-containing protein n=1 Tax=Trypanosoma theileri TaxID=67003 RepID=A0A1X0NT27_9TRYP|nr:uncharacterized protein TM35_000191100 [Trypanosoma theileri]ORC87866.1 hypothetical protein TM35_000191100 [Trypanosoma theileri]
MTRKQRRNRRWLCVDVPSVQELSETPDEELARRTLPKGFYLWFLMHDMRTMYAVLSERVFLTRGVLDYLYDYTRWGPNKLHSKLFLCTEYNQHQKCSNGFLCREVHCGLSTESALDATAFGVLTNANGCPTAVNAKDGTSRQPQQQQPPPNVLLSHTLHSRWTPVWAAATLPRGVTFRVALPNNPKPVEEYDSGWIFVTKVVRDHYERLLNNEPPLVTLQHCANFAKNGVCCFGPSCQFVHVVHYGDPCEMNTLEDTNSVSSGKSCGNSSPSHIGKKTKSASITDSVAESSKTSRHGLTFSLPTSPGASITNQPRFHARENNAYGSSLPNNQYVLLPPNVMQAEPSPMGPPRPQLRQQQQQPFLSPESLSCFNPMGAPVFLLPGSDRLQQQQMLLQQQQQQQQPVYTIMLPSPDGQLGPVSPIFVMPY